MQSYTRPSPFFKIILTFFPKEEATVSSKLPVASSEGEKVKGIWATEVRKEQRKRKNDVD